jgi:hypothetical protein
MLNEVLQFLFSQLPRHSRINEMVVQTCHPSDPLVVNNNCRQLRGCGFNGSCFCASRDETTAIKRITRIARLISGGHPFFGLCPFSFRNYFLYCSKQESTFSLLKTSLMQAALPAHDQNSFFFIGVPFSVTGLMSIAREGRPCLGLGKTDDGYAL